LAGIAASLASVAGFLLSLRSGDGLWLLCGLGTAVFFLYAAYAICSDYTGAAPSTNTYSPFVFVDTGTAFCFRTTAGKLAWATVEAIQPDTNTAVLQVFIWG
jgi:hypothetical protein